MAKCLGFVSCLENLSSVCNRLVDVFYSFLSVSECDTTFWLYIRVGNALSTVRIANRMNASAIEISRVV